jgi:glycosyltransferase involved in cell wall biosynthesis
MQVIMDGISPRVEQRNKVEARQALGLETNAKIVPTVGRLSKQKGQNTLIEAFRSVPDAKLYLIGDGELRADTEAQIARLGLQERVHLVGEIPGEQVATYLRASDVFAFPSRWETFGLAIIEAAASGVPLISSDLDVLQEVLSLENGTPAAMMVPVDEVSRWTQALNDMLNDPDLQQSFSEKSLQVSKRHSLESHVDNIEKLVESI